MKPILITLLTFLTAGIFSLNAQTEKVAIFSSVDKGNTGYGDIFREVLSEKLTKSSRFSPVERDLIDQVLKENEYQSSGMVDESTASQIGKQLGADYVCISIIYKVGENFFVTAKLVSVSTALVKLQENGMTQNGDKDLFEVMGKISKALLLPSPGNDEQINLINEGVLQDTRGPYNKKYRTININGKTWMAENLDHATKDSKYYGNIYKNREIYGRLYDWVDAMDACPRGWRLPTIEEWKEIVNYAQTQASKGNENPLFEGGIMKINILFGGSYEFGNRYKLFFNGLEEKGYYWSLSEYNQHRARYIEFNKSDKTIHYGNADKEEKLSCRCVKIQ